MWQKLWILRKSTGVCDNVQTVAKISAFLVDQDFLIKLFAVQKPRANLPGQFWGSGSFYNQGDYMSSPSQVLDYSVPYSADTPPTNCRSMGHEQNGLDSTEFAVNIKSWTNINGRARARKRDS